MGDIQVNEQFGPHRVKGGSITDLRYTDGRKTSPLHEFSPGIGLNDWDDLCDAADAGYDDWLDYLNAHYPGVYNWIMGHDEQARADFHAITIRP